MQFGELQVLQHYEISGNRNFPRGILGGVQHWYFMALGIFSSKFF